MFGGFLLLGGHLADILGDRGVFMARLVVFSVGSLLCGLAWGDASLLRAEHCHRRRLYLVSWVDETRGAVMKIFVAGATGVLGRALVPQLVARGHEVR
jgi:MFS family permease